mmetsp:Transcript_21218/g.39783  ORF Transcript_21218/g.39783 Transcript_21218/m.39783 type:complete len:297 (-) Transcript_21218:275-1165(-)
MASRPGTADWQKYASVARPIHTPQRRMRDVERNIDMSQRAREAEKFRILKNALESMRISSASRKKSVKLEPLKLPVLPSERTKAPPSRTGADRQTAADAPAGSSNDRRRPSAAAPPRSPSASAKDPKVENKEKNGDAGSVPSPAVLRDKIAQTLPSFHFLCQHLSLFAAIKSEMKKHKKEWQEILDRRQSMTLEEWKRECKPQETQIKNEIQGLLKMLEETGRRLHSYDEGLWELYNVFDKFVEMHFLWEDNEHDQKYAQILRSHAVHILKGVAILKESREALRASARKTSASSQS